MIVVFLQSECCPWNTWAKIPFLFLRVLNAAKARELNERDFGEKLSEAAKALEGAINQLDIMYQQACQLEAAQQPEFSGESSVNQEDAESQKVVEEATAKVEELFAEGGVKPVDLERLGSEESIKDKMNRLMYSLIKEAARGDFSEFLHDLSISDSDYEAIKAEWLKIGITKTYI